MRDKKIDRPIIFVANSSWYLDHYRSGLIRKCATLNKVIALSPIDKSTECLSINALHIPWNINRENSKSFIALILDFLRMYNLLRILKPKLIHSHTLKANLIVVVCAYFLKIPIVLSFTGLGKLNTKKNSIILSILLKIIYFIGILENNNLLRFSRNYNRTKYIFQNAKDKRLFEKICNPQKSKIFLIYGSGVPDELINFAKNNVNNFNYSIESSKNNKINGCIYCGRLLRSKGIKIFTDISKLDSKRKYFVYGEIDNASADSFKEEEIKKLKQNKNLEFKGFVKNPLLKFRNKNYILLVPSIYGEGVPRAIAEALFLEIPVICSSNALSEIFTSDMVYVVDKRDPKSFLKKIEQVENELGKKIYQDKISQGKNFVIKNMSEKKIISETLKIYKTFEHQNI